MELVCWDCRARVNPSSLHKRSIRVPSLLPHTSALVDLVSVPSIGLKGPDYGLIHTLATWERSPAESASLVLALGRGNLHFDIATIWPPM